MKLRFPGTRGYIDVRSALHAMHSTMMVEYHGREVMLDCGEDWAEKVRELSPNAIFVTHSHPDHAGGLKLGAPAPVYATGESWERMESFDIPMEARKVVRPRQPLSIGDITLEAFAVVHSTRAPAVGYRIRGGSVTVFYVPDVVRIKRRAEALRGVRLYIGDGASITRSMVRKSKGALIGHAPIRTQLDWCREQGVSRALFTHCGSDIVKREPGEVDAKIRELARERGLQAGVARDGMELTLR
jgi:phosphoribosyl 1,2-cyclic phosphodiesterase